MTKTKAYDYAKHAASAAIYSQGIRNYHLGACVVRGNRYFTGVNSYRTHPLQARFGKNPYAIHLHAEIAAMVKAKWQADALVVVRLLADGSWGCSRPCDGCRRALSRVPEVWFSNETGELQLL